MAYGLKAKLNSNWILERSGGDTIDLSEILALLEAVDATGTISGACKACGVSYRHAWGVLRRAEQQFQRPLIETSRRRGSELSTFGQQLIWANRRVNARLMPTLESMASELQEELEQFFPQPAQRLKLHASHGFAVEGLLQLANDQGLMPLELRYRTGSEALASLAQSECHLAGFQIAMGEFEPRLLHVHASALHPDRHCLINLSTRKTGLIVQAGNPRDITAISDLMRPDVRFVNRQSGSSTRSLVDCLLESSGVDTAHVRGYDSSEFTHMAIAAHVASGMADAGFGIETAAWRFGLTFIPLAHERYFFAAHKSDLNSPAMQTLLDLLVSENYRDYLSQLVGYDASALGQVQSVREAFGHSYDASLQMAALAV